MEARVPGTYKGDFGGSPIYITINYCRNNKLAGYDTHKGLRRNLSGTIVDKGFKYAIQLSEPGDHEFDGVFLLVMDGSPKELKGVWRPVNSKSLTEKQLHLREVTQDSQLGFFSGDHSDFHLDADGSCILNYYEKINDSTFSPQMITLRGTWEKKPQDEILVNWQPNPAYPERSTVFKATYVKGIQATPYLAEIKGDIFSFTTEEGF
jgi:hypothetical protein